MKSYIFTLNRPQRYVINADSQIDAEEQFSMVIEDEDYLVREVVITNELLEDNNVVFL